MDLDPSPASAHGDGGGCADAWPFDSLTTSLLFSSVSASPQLPPLPANSSSWFTPPSPLWLFEDRHLIPLDAPAAAPEAAVAAAVVDEVQRARSGNSDTSSKRVEQTDHKWQFHLSLDEDGTDNSSLFKERLTQALRYFKESTDQHLLVQVWAPVKNGDRYVLTTSGQPFVLDHQSIGLLQYRAVSMMYMFSVDGENVGELDLPGRVYKQKVPEWTPNVQYYSSGEYQRLNHAISYNVHGTVALPVFDPSAQSCIAVVELIMTSKKINYACEVDKVCKALEAVNLKSTEILDHPNVQVTGKANDIDLVDADSGEDEVTEKQSGKKENPLFEEVTILSGGQGKNPGGTKKWQCKHCNKTFSSTVTRMNHHFFGAPPGKKAHIIRCSALQSDRAKYRELYEKIKKGGSSSSKVAPIKMQTPLADAFSMMERDAVDMAIMRCLCANGIPFNVLRSPQWSEMVAAINRAPKGYKSPSSEKARTTLLDACKRNVEQDLAPVRNTWYTQGVSIVSDGWTNMKNQPLINVIASNSRGSMFLYADDFSGIEKTGENIAEYLLKAIDEIGPSNVLQIVTDNASNCKAAGREIEKVHKHIFWSPCVVHTVNLMFKDLANALPWMEKTYKAGKAVVKFVLNHQHGLAIFRSNSKLDLLRVAKTRFASHYILLKRLSDCREALATTVVTKQWKDWMKANSSDQYAKAVVETINSEEFWAEVENVLALTKPLFLMVKYSDGEGPKMGEVYERMDSMLGEVTDVMTNEDYPHSEDFPKVNEIIINRWSKMNIPLHCLAFALCPKFYDTDYLKTPAPGGIPRKAPNQDKEVMRGVLEAFSKITDGDAERKILQEEFTAFHMKKGMFALPAVQTDATTMSPIDWWSNYGSEAPNLAEVALKVLSQPISSSSAERSWSTYSFVWNVKRNKLNSKTADKLVYVHSNIRLQSRFSESYKAGPSSKWDADPEDASLEESRLKLEQLRWKDLEKDVVNDPLINEPSSSSKKIAKNKK